MLNPYGRKSETLQDAGATVFELLGGTLSAIDTWTRIDFSWMHDGAALSGDVVGYAGLPMSFRVAGLTLGDADAAPMSPPFVIEISPDRLIAQVVSPRAELRYRGPLSTEESVALHHWAAGSLSKNLQVVQFGDGDIGLEADLHLADSTPIASLREFVTAFSWDVAALHARDTDGAMLTTEEWVRRAALSISRSTPTIPLREHAAPAWRSFETPPGVFCSLQPSGGLCESDNVLYAVSRDVAAMHPLATMPGSRSDWDYSRLTEVWLARDGAACLARTLLCEGFFTGSDGQWHPVGVAAVTAIAPWRRDGFLLGLHDGKVVVFDGTQAITIRRRLSRHRGRFSRLIAFGDRAIGLIGTTLVSGLVLPDVEGTTLAAEAWEVSLELAMSFDLVGEIDVDCWSSSPAVAVLGDECVVIVDAHTGAHRARYAVQHARHAKWIGPNWLLMLDEIESRTETRTRVRVLDVAGGRWTEPVVTAEISRVAVRGDEIHVGFANQSIAVWDRLEVCRGIGAWMFRTDVPEHTVTPTIAPPVAAPADAGEAPPSR